MQTIRSLCVYAGACKGKDKRYEGACRALASHAAALKIRLVYGGGHIGLMGVLADTALECGGEVIGVMPQALIERESGHSGLTELHVVDSMHERKALMAELSDAFVAVPGGIGTLEETIEVFTWTQLGFQSKPVGLLNVGGYFDRLLGFLDYAVEQGFLDTKTRSLLQVSQDPHELFELLSEIDLEWLPLVSSERSKSVLP